MTDIATALRQQWNLDVAAAGFPTLAADKVFADSLVRHSETHRRYHGQRHLAALLDLITTHAPHLPPGSAPRLAVWWHDLVYDPKSTTNEENSADIARQRLEAMGAAQALTDDTCRLILATKNHWDGPSMGEGDVFLDADIAILGAPPEVYDDYADNVRQEYAFAPDDLYRAGRAKFLNSALARPRLFRTDVFESTYAAQARANMQRELASLA